MNCEKAPKKVRRKLNKKTPRAKQTPATMAQADFLLLFFEIGSCKRKVK